MISGLYGGLYCCLTSCLLVVCQIKLPDNPSWSKLFGADMKDVKVVCNEILSLYHEAPAMWMEPLHPNAIVSRAVLETYEGRADLDVVSVAASSPTTPARTPTPLATRIDHVG